MGTEEKGSRGKGGATRERIMDVSEAHLAKSGYRGVSLERVAKEVGIRKPTLFYHFPEGKEELFVAIAHRSLRRVREGLERAMAPADDATGKLQAAARWLMAESERGHPLAELDDLSRFVNDRHHVALSEGFYESFYRPIWRVISDAVASGQFRRNDPDLLTWSFLGLASGMLDVERTSFESPAHRAIPRDTRAVADGMMDLFLNGVL